MDRHDSFRADGQEPIAGSKQVDFDDVCSAKHHVLTFLKIKSFALTGSLVCGANHFDRGHHPMARAHVDDLDVAFGSGLDVQIDTNTLLHPGPQMLRQLGLEDVTNVGDEGLVDIAPVLFEIRVHAWKRALHEKIS